jgi:hypothetical protein
MTYKSIITLTVTPHIKIEHCADLYVDDTKEALILLLELLLIEDLDSNDASVGDLSIGIQIRKGEYIYILLSLSSLSDIQVEAFIPIRVQGFLHNSGCMRLFTIDSNHSYKGRRVTYTAI